MSGTIGMVVSYGKRLVKEDNPLFLTIRDRSVGVWTVREGPQIVKKGLKTVEIGVGNQLTQTSANYN